MCDALNDLAIPTRVTSLQNYALRQMLPEVECAKVLRHDDMMPHTVLAVDEGENSGANFSSHSPTETEHGLGFT